MGKDLSCRFVHEVILRFAPQLLKRALDEILRVRLEPWVIEPHVVRHKVLHEFDSTGAQAFAQGCERIQATKLIGYLVGSDSEP